MKGEDALRILSPDSWGQQDVAVVLEIVDGAAPEHDVGQDVTTKAVEHGAEPGGHGTPAGNLHRAWNTEEQLSGSVLTIKKRFSFFLSCLLLKLEWLNK